MSEEYYKARWSTGPASDLNKPGAVQGEVERQRAQNAFSDANKSTGTNWQKGPNSESALGRTAASNGSSASWNLATIMGLLFGAVGALIGWSMGWLVEAAIGFAIGGIVGGGLASFRVGRIILAVLGVCVVAIVGYSIYVA